METSITLYEVNPLVTSEYVQSLNPKVIQSFSYIVCEKQAIDW